MSVGRQSGRRPVIGITPDIQNPPDKPALYEVKAAYAEAVMRGGGLPFVLAYSDDPAIIDSYLDRVSAVVVTGGAFDIPPDAYGAAPRDGMGPTKPARTAFETALTRRALDRNLPVLGVCGGMQLLNVLWGGSLLQDIQRERPHANNHEQGFDRHQPMHPVEVKDQTLLAELMGKGQLMVNSTHHQAADRVAEGVVTSAVAPDGIVEAIESKAHAFAVGVQWHPELLIHTVPVHLALYKALVQRSKR